jgi:hypothetical protein
MLNVVLADSEERMPPMGHPDIQIALKVPPANPAWIEPLVRKYVKDVLHAFMTGDKISTLHERFKTDMEAFGGLSKRNMADMRSHPNAICSQLSGPWDNWTVRGSGLSLLKYAYHLFMLQSVRTFAQLHHGEVVSPHMPNMYINFLGNHVQEKQLHGRPSFIRGEVDEFGWFYVYADFPLIGERTPYRVMMRVNFVTGDSIMGDCGNAECMTNAIPWLPDALTDFDGPIVER